ncbi:hypothetical protein DM01DRAFT_140796 [Hesseltinella vesiculosa]|uniref:Uncharacterized protein n=1 Tax=Hesseltinella vesiculosa TaxID=101127 RepID=A0A1X2G8Y3_9FUNG|nr:hypothetical protein DM01DRAFT_140796 [Hesseltinella vesiculosa]
MDALRSNRRHSLQPATSKKPWGGNAVAFPTAATMRDSAGSVGDGLAAIGRFNLCPLSS